MRAEFLSLLALNAVSVLAAPKPSTVGASAAEATQLEEIADLAAAAYKTAQKTKAAGTCDWSKVRVRREWYVKTLLHVMQNKPDTNYR